MSSSEAMNASMGFIIFDVSPIVRFPSNRFPEFSGSPKQCPSHKNKAK